MSKKNNKAGHPASNISVRGPVSGQFVVGDGNTVINAEGNAVINWGSIGGPPTNEELSQLRQAIEALKAQVVAQAPPEKQAAAVERLDELNQAITKDKQPKLSTLEYVRDWFATNIPTMAGAVTAVIVNPIVGALVKAGGDALVAEFKSKFGS